MVTMRSIAIVEDEDVAAELLIDYIDKYSSVSGQRFNVVRFKDAIEFLTDYKPGYAVVFMDIQMPRMNGMDATIELRKKDKAVSIVFITNMIQYAQKGYEVDAVSFLVKPVSYFDFSMKLRKALDIYVMSENRSITINLKSGLCRISTDKLMFVEVMKHRLYYHLTDEVIEFIGALSKAEEELSKYGFLRCNNCYLVNPKFVVNVKGNIVQVGNTELQISRPRRAMFLTELANWYAGFGGDV